MVSGRRRFFGAAFLFWGDYYVPDVQKIDGARRQHVKRNSTNSEIWPAAFAILALLISASSTFAQGHLQGPHSVVTLLSDRASLVPGGRVWVGVWFRMEKGWHIYWVNPGDSGEPPKIRWQLPLGFQVGSIEWPTPEKLTAPSIVDYGYENDVLLISPLTAPVSAKNGEEATIAAKVSWLVCRDICIPGKGQVSLTLPVKSAIRGWKGSASSADVAMLLGARSKVPKRPPGAWKISAASDQDDFVLNVETGKRENAATFFPLEPEQIKNSASQTATPFSRGVRLRLRKSDGLLKPISALRGVLVFGSGRAYEIAAPVKQTSR